MADDKQQGGAAKTTADPHPGMMGDGTEEQSLDQKGNPGARITQDEVEEAFKDKGSASDQGQAKSR